MKLVLNKIIRELSFINKRRKLNNHTFTLLTNNCLGGVIYHDLHLKFNSPLINLWIYPKDFIKFCKNIDYYVTLKLEFVKMDNITYPVAKLDDIYLYFQHYENEQDALLKWNERKKRIDKNNMYIILIEKDGCTYDDLLEFDKLPFMNKIIFTHINYPMIKSAYKINGFEKEKELGDIFNYIELGKKPYDEFSIIRWLNNEDTKKRGEDMYE